MTVLALVANASISAVFGVLAFAYFLRRREERVQGAFAAGMGAAFAYAVARIAQTLNQVPDYAPTLSRVTLSLILVTTLLTLYFANAYTTHRASGRERALVTCGIALTGVVLWLTDGIVTHTTVARSMGGGRTFLGVTVGPAYPLFPFTVLPVAALVTLRLVRASFWRQPDGRLIAASYGLALFGFVFDVICTQLRIDAPRVSDFAFLPLGFAFSLAQVRRFARLFDDLEGRMHQRTGQLASVSARLRTAIVEREMLQRRLAEANRLEALGRLTGGVAHDFNNLLTVIVAENDFVADVAADPRVTEASDRVREAARRAAALIRQLLSVARRQPVAPVAVDVGARTADLLGLLRPLVGRLARIELKTHGIARVLIDPSQLEQIVMNLVVNARDAMPEGGEIAIEVDRLDKLPDYVPPLAEHPKFGIVRLSVRDGGTGIPPDLLTRVFEPFFTTKEGGKGTGLGLATVMGAAKQSGGAVTVKSPPGQGTLFEVFLPALPLENGRRSSYPPGSA